MNALVPYVLFFAVVAPATLDQVRAEPNLERRARAAVDFAAAAERDSESAYSKRRHAGEQPQRSIATVQGCGTGAGSRLRKAV